MKKLLFLEGVSGVGKSSLTVKLAARLQAQGALTSHFLEGDSNSPLDLCFAAYLSPAEYADLLRANPAFSAELQKNSLCCPGGFAVRYQGAQGGLYSPTLRERLRRHEGFYTAANPPPFPTYKAVFAHLWRSFAASAAARLDYAVFDGSLLHHQLNDMLRGYAAAEGEMIEHLSDLLLAVQPLNPVVFYLVSPNIEERLRSARLSRGETPPSEEQIAFWAGQKHLALSILPRLPVEFHILDIGGGNWTSALDAISSLIAVSA
jgi:hypothetical protein